MILFILLMFVDVLVVPVVLIRNVVNYRQKHLPRDVHVACAWRYIKTFCFFFKNFLLSLLVNSRNFVCRVDVIDTFQ